MTRTLRSHLARISPAGDARLPIVLGAILALVLALACPLVVFGLGHARASAEITTKALVKAEMVTQTISTAPEIWRYQEHRLNEQLQRYPVELASEQVRIVAGGEVVVASRHQIDTPVLAHSEPLYDAGTVVGALEIRRSLRPLLWQTALAAGVGLLLATTLLGVLLTLHRREARLSAAMRAEQERARVTLHSIGDAVITTDAQTRVVYMNPQAERLTQWTQEAARGRLLGDVCQLIDESSLQPVDSPLDIALHTGQTCSLPVEAVALLRKDGSSMAIEESASPLHDARGQVIGGALVFRDVTATRRMAQRISWAATHDALTGLPNRREFETRVDTALQTARSENTSHALFYLDLDQFKIVNDTCGHPAGDGLLRQIAPLLLHTLSYNDVLARLGGDEFGVLVQNCTLERARQVAADMLATALNFRFAWEDKVFTVTASIGVVMIDARSGTRAEVFSAADTACYSAKDQGRNRYCLFESSDSDMSRRRAEMDWASRLTRALEEDRLRLHYQTYQALSDPAQPGVHIELLVRLEDEDGRLIPPGAFLPAAERYGIMPAIDRWVIRTAFARYRELAGLLGQPLTCAINLSGTTLNSEGLLDYIRAQAEAHALPPRTICFEITETAAINNMRLATQFMTDMKALGFCFALDDFGIGTSSFAYLKVLPVDYLKIDGSFVRNINHDPIDRAMTETINRIGHLMGLRTVGEFAESAEVIAELQAIGVDFAQGYGVQRPQPLPMPPQTPSPSVLSGLAADPALQHGGRAVVHDQLLAPAQVDQVAHQPV